MSSWTSSATRIAMRRDFSRCVRKKSFKMLLHLHVSKLLNLRYGRQVTVGHRIQKGCKAMGKLEKRHPAIQKSLQCTFNSADMQSDTSIFDLQHLCRNPVKRRGIL